MTQADYKKRYEQLLKKVGQMRFRQKRWEAYYVTSEKPLKKQAEREVDKLVEEGAKIIESNQSEIFN
jgi:hypothetical protein